MGATAAIHRARRREGIDNALALRTVLFVLVVGCACSRTLAPATTAPDAAQPPAVEAPPPRRTGAVTRYQTTLTTQGRFTALRTFEQGSAAWRLVVDPMTLSTQVVPDVGDWEPADWTTLDAKFPGSPWLRARADADQHAASLQDAGLTHLLPSETGVVLTVDLCPSTKHFDLRLLKQLLDVVEPIEKPIPVAFALSGLWALEHPDELERLRALDGRDLAITWMNHSMHHRYAPGKPLTQNFMLEAGTNAATEVLDAEVVMLEHGVLPSVFFRFPGLVSEPTLVTFVTALGLVPVGSDAWLAKGERAKSGSIVLVHGNGNEPQGVADFVRLLNKERKAISTRQFLLLDLREGLVEEEEAHDH